MTTTMRITNTYLRDLSVNIDLGESGRFDLPFDSFGSEGRAGLTINLFRLRGTVNLLDGTATVTGHGFLRRRDGSVGERDRSMYLTSEQVPEEAKGIIAEEARSIRAQIGSQTGVTFE